MNILIAGTDYSWRLADLTAKKQQIAKEKAQAERAAAQETEALQIADLTDKLAQFYGAWGVPRLDDELKNLALKYFTCTDELNDKLRKRYGGTDLSTPILEIAQAKASQEEESREKQGKERIEAEQNAEHDAGQSDTGAATLERSLREFYASWQMSRPDSEIDHLVDRFLGKEGELNQLLQKRYFGTDTTWSREEIMDVQMQQDIDDTVDKLRAFYKVWAKPFETRDLVRLAESYRGNLPGLNDALRSLHKGTDLESSHKEIQRKRQEVDIEKLEQALKEFYAQGLDLRLGQKQKSSVQILELATSYVGREAELNEKLRETCHGADLTWSQTAIAAKIQELSAKMQELEDA